MSFASLHLISELSQISQSAVSRVSKPADRASGHAAPIWKSPIQQVWKPALRRVVASATVLLRLATFARAQDSQFLFEAKGNLFVQSAEASAPPQILGQPQNQLVE